MRLAVDTGGTFTDLVIEDDAGQVKIFKSSTTPDEPMRGILNVLDRAAAAMHLTRAQLLGKSEVFIHGTTLAINAVLTKRTARTALLTTEGHPDILVFRDGGRPSAFDFKAYPDPYIPRALTFEVPERIGSGGEVVTPLDEDKVARIIDQLAEVHVEAVAVCLLWSVVNPVHELRVGDLIGTLLPDVAVTLSHQVNPILREYRRASSAAIDASLKPVMTRYLNELGGALGASGFGGRVLVVTSAGGVLDATDVARAPVYAIGSGPAMAPVAGREFARLDATTETAIITDTGGTSFDVSLVQHGHIPRTKETWLGEPYLGHMTGFPAIDVKSIGAGGGSIAWVDEGGLLHVGPDSAGADPGPVCYGRGGMRPTVSDASLVLGYLDAKSFLGGTIRVNTEAAAASIRERIAGPLGFELREAASAILEVTTEHMVRVIEEITVGQGIDPRSAVLVGGGGAAGLNIVPIARRLGCPRVVLPRVGSALSAAGALMSDLIAEFSATRPTTSQDFAFETINNVLLGLEAQCQEFATGPGASAEDTTIAFFAEARYPHQIWELEVPIPSATIGDDDDVQRLRLAFHAKHREVFAIDDPESEVEFVGWRARVACRLRHKHGAWLAQEEDTRRMPPKREVYFREMGLIEVPVRELRDMAVDSTLAGPTIIELPLTSVVIHPGANVFKARSGSLIIDPGKARGAD